MKNNIVTSKKPAFLSKKDTNYLIGDWCLSDKILKYKYKYKNLKDYGDDKKKIEKKLSFLFKIYIKILKNFAVALNKYHNVKLSERYWETLISRWLWHFLMFTHDRWEIVKKLKKVNGNFYNKVDNYDEKIFIKKNTRSFIHNSHTPEWNSWIYSKILGCYHKFEIIKTNIYIKKVKKKREESMKFLKIIFSLKIIIKYL